MLTVKHRMRLLDENTVHIIPFTLENTDMIQIKLRSRLLIKESKVI